MAVDFSSSPQINRLVHRLIKRARASVFRMALLSLHTGMRAGEIFSLTWADVDLAGVLITLRDTKSNRTRHAFMTEQVRAMFQARDKQEPAALVFPGRNGKKIVQISKTFNRAVDRVGLNDGNTDPRQKVTFHTLRHTFASWLVESGTDIYLVKELLGHSDSAQQIDTRAFCGRSEKPAAWSALAGGRMPAGGELGNVPI
ncbi:MAG: site-specific integrase [Desulfurivibrio sp.]